jgi:hypothetical protein
VLIVTVPEELPVLEARDLWQRLQSLPSPASAGIVLNAVLEQVRPVGPLPRALAPRATRDPVLAAIASAGGEEARLAVLHANRILARRREALGQYLGMLRDTQAPLWSVPFVPPDPEDERAWTARLQAAVRAAGLASALEAPA